MMSLWWGVAAVWCAAVGVAGQANPCFPEEQPELNTPSFPSSVERFGLDFFKRVWQRESASGRSVFVSPYSVWSALTLAYLGSGGETQRQMQTALHLTSKTSAYNNWNALKLLLENRPQEEESGAILEVTNRAYFSDQLRLSPCLSNTLFDLRVVDFSNPERAREAINQEVNATTRGRIPELIKFLLPQTRFALVNAVFFKGQWQTAFRPEDTRRQEFLVPPGESDGVVDMMVMERLLKQGYSEALDATMLELPYRNSSISMFLLLPKTWSTASIVNNLTPQNFAAAYRLLAPQPTVLGLPRFKMNTRLENELKEVLMSAGIVDLFQADRSNLTAFTTTGVPLSVDQTIHQATVEVTEEGTVATAATALINTRFGGGNPVPFMCNRPFVFLITDKKSGITLFAGEIRSAKDLESI